MYCKQGIIVCYFVMMDNHSDYLENPSTAKLIMRLEAKMCVLEDVYDRPVTCLSCAVYGNK